MRQRISQSIHEYPIWKNSISWKSPREKGTSQYIHGISPMKKFNKLGISKTERNIPIYIWDIPFEKNQ